MKNLFLTILLLATPPAVMAQTAVFTDNFTNGSTTNKTSVPGGTPTASSTSYDIASSKTATNSPPGGHLKIGLSAATGSGFFEVQALFTGTPVALATPGDYINLTYTFTNTQNVLSGGAGTASGLFTGLYNSGGTPPVAGSLASAGLNTTSGSAYASSYCANWQGYVARIQPSGGTGATYTRPAQNPATGTTSGNQELIGNGFGSGTYTNPPGVFFGDGPASTVTLTAGAQYTNSCTIVLTAAGTLTISNNLYDSSGNLLFSLTNSATGTGTNLVQSFDGLCIGIRNSSSSSLDPIIDISQITVTKSIFGSPGPVFNVTGGGTDCAGSQIAVGLSGSVTTNNYSLYTNGVFSGLVASGTGSALSFPAETVLQAPLTNTVVASNTVSGFTGLMSGSVVVAPLAAPAITVQPSAVLVATNSVGVFTVIATGGGLGYQWYRNGTRLTDGGDVTGSGTSTLVISPATAADAAATAQGYYCWITNTCGSTTISTTNSLTLDAPANIVWQGGNPNTNWDLATTANFTNGTGAAVKFNGGDKVAFDDSSTNPLVNIVSSNLAPTLVTERAGQNYIFNGSGTITGPGALLMNGSGVLSISNVNTYAGGTTISNGTLAISGAGNAIGSGPLTLAGGTLEAKTASGSGTAGLSNVNVTVSSTLQFDGSGTYALNILGSLTGSSAATLTIYNYLNNSSTFDRVRLYGSFTNSLPIVISTLGNEVEFAPYNATGLQVYNGIISGNGGRLVPRGAGGEILNGANTFNDSGVSGGTGASGYSLILSGSNLGLGSDSAGNYPSITSSPVGTGNVGIDVTLGNVTIYASGAARTIANELIYNSATNTVTLAIGGSNSLTWSGPFQLNGADNTGNTNRTVQVNNTALTSFSGVIDDASQNCGIIKTGNGVLALNATNTYAGPTIVSNGMLEGTGFIATSPVTIEPSGTLGAGTTAIGTFTLGGGLTFGGNALFKLNKSLASVQSNDLVSVSGTLTNAGAGTLTVTNLGPVLTVGDKFKLFSQPVLNGGALTVTGGGANWTNRLALDGSIAVLSVSGTVATNRTNIMFSVTGTNLTLSWPADHLGWYLQVQTNTLSTGLGTNWSDVANSSTLTNVVVPVNPNNPAVFYRMSLQP
jgi:autotransporter-associated beta strand protein